MQQLYKTNCLLTETKHLFRITCLNFTFALFFVGNAMLCPITTNYKASKQKRNSSDTNNSLR